MPDYLIYGISYGFAVAVIPGPLLTYLIAQSLNYGWKRALPAALAPLISDGPIALSVLLVLSQVPPGLIQVFRMLGGAFLLYLAYEAGQSWRQFDSLIRIRPVSSSGSVLKAATVNWLNPNPYLSWSLVLGPMLLNGWRSHPAFAIALLAGFYSTMILCTAAIMTLAAAAGTVKPRVNRILIGLSSLVLAGYGLYQLWMGLAA
jgi:threonine/homoserine/homoserine lactone efflux protein